MTARDTILLAALDCSATGPEFTEFDLTVASWRRNKQLFGLRGHADAHPDHKRVYMEIAGRKPQNPVVLGLLERTKPNTYRLTPLGRSVAAAMLDGKPVSKPATHYDCIAALLALPEFTRWCDDPAEPRQLNGLKLDVPAAKVSIDSAMAWLNEHDCAYLTAPGRQGIHYNQLAELLDFLTVLRARFPKLKEAS